MRKNRLSICVGQFLRNCSAGLLSLAVAFSIVGASSVSAQLPQTRLYSIAPMGGKAGVTLDVKVTNGADLDELNSLLFNHPGLKAVAKTQDSGGKQVPVANTFVVTVAANVPPGTYEVRTAGLFGLSNPRSFEVGDRDEITEAEGNNTREQAQEIKQNVVVNSVIGGATDIDFYRIEGKKGQRILVNCRAIQLDSRLSATLGLYDANGRRLSDARGNSRNDPLLDVTLPADGQYFVKVHDFLYRGGADYGYRLIAGTGPHIDYVLPPSGTPGSTSTYTLFGRNLPGGQDAGVKLDGKPLQKLNVSIALPKDESTLQTSVLLPSAEAAIDAISYVHKSPLGSSNPVQIYLATAPVLAEKEPNDEVAQAQQVTVPAEIGGQFQARGDTDYFDFTAKAGEVYYIEVFGQRSGGSADPYFTLEQVTKNDKGVETVKRITIQDDNTKNLSANVFDTITDDPVYRFQVPADSTYRVMLRDRYFEVRGYPNLVYRLSIRRENPDFRVVAIPTPPTQAATSIAQSWSIAVRKGDNVKIDLLAFRQDGFNGTIDVTVEGLPKGVICKGASIGPKQTKSVLIFTATDDAPEWAGLVKVNAKARIEDPQKARGVVTANAAVKAAAAALPKLQTALAKTIDTQNKAKDPLAKANALATKAAQDRDAAKKKSDADALAFKTAQAAATAATKKSTDAAAAVKTATDAKTAADKGTDENAKTAAAKALTDAQAAAKKAVEELAVAKTTATAADAVAKTSAAATVKAEAVVKDTGNKAKAADAVQKAADLAAKTATDAKQAGDKKVADAQAGLTKAEADNKAASREVARSARVGTIAWSGAANVPGVARVAQSLGLSVLKETAPYQVTTDVFRVEANQSRQILVPVKLAKRNGFDNNVALTFQGLPPKTNIQIVNKPIAKGKNEVLLRIFLNANAVVGTYTLYLKGQGQVPYKRNPEREVAAKAAQVKAAEVLKVAQAAATKATQNRDAAKKKAVADTAALKKATDAVTAATKKATDTAAAVKAATDGKAAADKGTDDNAKAATAKALTDAQAAAKKAGEELAAAQKVATAADAVAKTSAAANVTAEAAVKTTAAASTAATAAKKAADTAATAATNAAKPKNINCFFTSTPIVIDVKPGPATLTAVAPGGGALKKGQKIDVKVTIKRINGFVGPITLTLPAVPGVTGVTAQPVTIPADKSDGVLSISAAGDATEGQLANLVVRGTMDFAGKAAVDVPVVIKVAK